MAKPILDEALWAVLELLLPPDPPRPRGGRPRVPRTAAATSRLWVDLNASKTLASARITRLLHHEVARNE